MDPNALLEELRTLVESIFEADSRDDNDTLASLGSSLAGKLEELDCWILGGGFLPESWEGNNTGRNSG